MNTEIRFLNQLDEDLADAARRDAARGGASPGDGKPPRRLPRRGSGTGGNHRGQLVAAAMAILVLAGGIGFVAQGGGSDDGGGEALSAPDVPLTQGGGDEGGTMAPVPAEGLPAIDDGRRRFAVDTLAGSHAGAGTFAGYRSARDEALPVVIAEEAAPDAPATQPQDLSKIVRDGRIEVEVANGAFDRNVSAVSRIATNNGGFVLTSSSRDGQAGTFTLRIPAKRFDEAMDQLRELGTVKADQVTGDDVTADFIDLRARLKILTERRQLLRELQADASSSGEILRLAGLIDDVQFQIENIQGNLNFLKDQVAEATIKVELHEQDAPEDEQPSDVDAPSLSKAFDYALQGFMRVLGAVVVGLGYLIPLAVLGLLGWLAFRTIRRRGARKS